MNRSALVIATASAVMSALSPAPVRAQAYPMPASDTEPPAICTTCSDTASKDKPTWPYSAPIKAFAGRFVDSQATRGYQHGTGYRTVRAKEVITAPALNRVYIVAGEGLEIFDYDTFFTQRLRPDGSTLIHAPGYADPGFTREKYLKGAHTIYAEWPYSGWITAYMDGQERLYDADVDDRGYIYLAYDIFGWGIHEDQGSTVPLLFQDLNLLGTAIMSVRAKGRYYAVVSESGGLGVFDTTTPSSPIKKAYRSMMAPMAWARAEGTDPVIALVTATGNLNFYTLDGLVSDTPFYTSSKAGFRTVASDGTNFYAGRPYELVAFRANGGGFTEQVYPTDLQMLNLLRFGKGGFLSAAGNDVDYRIDARLWRLENGEPKPIALHSFFKRYYNTPPAGYAKPLNYTAWVRDFRVEQHAEKTYLFWANDGLGDVYELDVPALPSPDAGTGTGTEDAGTPHPAPDAGSPGEESPADAGVEPVHQAAEGETPPGPITSQTCSTAGASSLLALLPLLAALVVRRRHR